MIIKVKELVEGCMPEIIKKGDWVDLRAAITVELNAPQSGVLKKSKEGNFRNVELDVTNIPLGVAIQLPEGYEAIIAARSSTPKKFGIITANSIGVVDNSYCGDKDEWNYPAIPIRKTVIEQGTRIAQFRVQLSQKATIWQKIKWLFTNKIKFVKVDNLNNNNRGGFGSTGSK